MGKAREYGASKYPSCPERSGQCVQSVFAVLFLWQTIVLTPPAYGQHNEQTACVPDIGKEVITHADIVRYGFFRLSDVLALSTPWHTAGLEGFHWQNRPRQASRTVRRAGPCISTTYP